MTNLIRYPLFLLFLLTGIMSCNNNEQTVPVNTAAPSKEKELGDAIARFPDSLLLREQLVQYYRENALYDKALTATDEWLKKDSLNARLWDMKATLHFENADTLDAIRAFEKAAAILPAPEYLMSLGTLYAQTKNVRALAAAGLLAKLDNGKTAKEGIFIKGLYYSYTGDKEKAISFFDQCLAMEYTFMPGYLEKAIALYDQAKYAEAIKVLDRAVTLQNNFDEGYYWRGRCHEKINKLADAMEDYRTALMYNPEYAEAKDALARLEGK